MFRLNPLPRNLTVWGLSRQQPSMAVQSGSPPGGQLEGNAWPRSASPLEESPGHLLFQFNRQSRRMLKAIMKPRVKRSVAHTPAGDEMALYQHGSDFSITINGRDLMLSRQHESELDLARIGCRHLSRRRAPCVLIGGLGMGYTLRQTLDILAPDALVLVCELMEAVVDWNREFFGELNGHPLRDGRVVLKMGDVVELISRTKDRFDAILLDIDNGPEAMANSGSHRLYGKRGIESCLRALRKRGLLAIWSAGPGSKLGRPLVGRGFHVRRFPVPAHKGSRSPSRSVWVASRDRSALPLPAAGSTFLSGANESRTPGNR